MLLALALQAAAPQTAVDAERAFNAAAQAKGQWTAFREFAAPEAIVFTPQPEKAETALPTKNPPIAVQWWPAESFVSCDDSAAVNTGPWVRPKAGGYFTTVWVRESGGAWKWALDHGDALSKPRAWPEKVKVRRAACGAAPGVGTEAPDPDETAGGGNSTDHTLSWYWSVDRVGGRNFVVQLWNGHAYERVLRNDVAAPTK